MPDIVLPAPFRAAIATIHGAAGEAWLAELPARAIAAAARWQVRLEAVYPATYSLAIAGARGDRPVVLKAAFPCGESRGERLALAHYGGRGAVRLLEQEEETGILLLERAVPGTTLIALTEESDARATSVAAGVMLRLHSCGAPPAGLPHVTDWLRAFSRLRSAHGTGTGPLDRSLVERAEGLAADLGASAPAPVLLHGDLHHGNVVENGGGWLAIDPKGVLGEPAYECGALLRNPLEWLPHHTDIQRVLARRTAQLAEELNIDAARIEAWGFVHAVLSACWSLEDGDPDKGAPAMRVAGALRAISHP